MNRLSVLSSVARSIMSNPHSTPTTTTTTSRSGGRGYASSGRRPSGTQSNYRGRGGRGGGRGAAQPPTQTLRPLRIYTSDFASFRKSCQYPASFKVHRPKCSCPNITAVVSPPNNNNNNNNNNNRTMLRVGNDKDESEEEWFAEQVTNGLLVVPHVQTRSISCVYVCLDTTTDIFDLDPKSAELKLQTELFPTNQLPIPSIVSEVEGADKTIGSNNEAYKVSCAACLLEDVPNGFVCVSSMSRESVDRVRDEARQRAENKIDASKHSDHAHFVATLPMDALMKLNQSKTRSQVQAAQDEVVQHLVNQGVPIEPDTHDIKIQHHLSTLLWLFKDRHNPSNRKLQSDGMDSSSYFWLVLGYNDTETSHPHWSLDLPGGKRHLGESTMEAAIRETEEETSLVWDADWIREELRGQGRSDFMNLYYMLSPPTDG